MSALEVVGAAACGWVAINVAAAVAAVALRPLLARGRGRREARAADQAVVARLRARCVPPGPSRRRRA